MTLPKSTQNPPDFQLIFEAVSGLYLVLNSDLHIVAVSQAYLTGTLTKQDQIMGLHFFEAFPENPADPQPTGTTLLRESLNRVLENRMVDAMSITKYDIPKPKEEGGGFEERYWSPYNAPVFGTDGRIAYIIHQVVDVTDFVKLKQTGEEQAKEIFLRGEQIERANSELKGVYEKLKELDKLKTQFFANVSHELRTPLTLILGPTQNMLADPNITQSQRQDLMTVNKNARTLLKQVNDLLDVAKLEAGKMTPVYTEFDLAGLAMDLEYRKKRGV